MIAFASYLDGNQKTMKKCDENIIKLKEEILEKEKEIAKKTKMLDILKLKAERIQMQKEAVDKYHQYLEEVKEANSDDYNEISDITMRYYTLHD